MTIADIRAKLKLIENQQLNEVSEEGIEAMRRMGMGNDPEALLARERYTKLTGKTWTPPPPMLPKRQVSTSNLPPIVEMLDHYFYEAKFYDGAQFERINEISTPPRRAIYAHTSEFNETIKVSFEPNINSISRVDQNLIDVGLCYVYAKLNRQNEKLVKIIEFAPRPKKTDVSYEFWNNVQSGELTGVKKQLQLLTIDILR